MAAALRNAARTRQRRRRPGSERPRRGSGGRARPLRALKIYSARNVPCRDVKRRSPAHPEKRAKEMWGRRKQKWHRQKLHMLTKNVKQGRRCNRWSPIFAPLAIFTLLGASPLTFTAVHSLTASPLPLTTCFSLPPTLFPATSATLSSLQHRAREQQLQWCVRLWCDRLYRFSFQFVFFASHPCSFSVRFPPTARRRTVSRSRMSWETCFDVLGGEIGGKANARIAVRFFLPVGRVRPFFPRASVAHLLRAPV